MLMQEKVIWEASSSFILPRSNSLCLNKIQAGGRPDRSLRLHSHLYSFIHFAFLNAGEITREVETTFMHLKSIFSTFRRPCLKVSLATFKCTYMILVKFRLYLHLQISIISVSLMYFLLHASMEELRSGQSHDHCWPSYPKGGRFSVLQLYGKQSAWRCFSHHSPNMATWSYQDKVHSQSPKMTTWIYLVNCQQTHPHFFSAWWGILFPKIIGWVCREPG